MESFSFLLNEVDTEQILKKDVTGPRSFRGSMQRETKGFGLRFF